MHIEVFQGKGLMPTTPRPVFSEWYWHFRNKGRVTADSEGFPSRGNAIRAAKAVVIAIVKETGVPTGSVVFGRPLQNRETGLITITWDQ